MILNGNSRAHGQELARHLLNVADNEHAVVHELRGFTSEDLMGAFKEIEAVASGTQCEQYLFSLSLNPPKTTSIPNTASEIAYTSLLLGALGNSRSVALVWNRFRSFISRLVVTVAWERLRPTTIADPSNDIGGRLFA